tara:strand:+ start:446 stop:1810 length:1365 start_codon:yes stop_codon:yes gene_type:complete
MAVFNNNLLAGAGAQSGGAAHTIDQSIRFNSNDSAYMYRTPSSASNRKTFTISFWFKTCQPVTGTFQTLIGSYDNSSASDSTYFGIWQGSSGNMGFGTWNSNPISTTRKIRDPASWFHCVYTIDTTNTNPVDRCKLFINGNRETNISYSDPGLNHDFGWNLNQQHSIGRINYTTGSGPYYTNGYLAEIYNIDGQALDCNSFGEFNSSGIWIPKAYSGTFGTNGFYIKGEDSSDLGNDSSGNNNDFTVSGLDSFDKMNDSPTNNHAVWNALTGSAQSYTNGNLKASSTTTYWKGGLTTLQVPLNSGTWYYEWYVTSAGSNSGQMSIGWCESTRDEEDDNSSGDTEGWVTYALNGNYYANGGTGSLGATYTTGDVIGCKINTNTSSNNVEWYKNGVSQGTRSQAFNSSDGSGFISPYILMYATRNGIARFDNIHWTQTPAGIDETNVINTKNLGAE